MMKKFLTAALLAVVIPGVWSCSDDDEKITELRLSTQQLTILDVSYAVVPVEEGSNNYDIALIEEEGALGVEIISEGYKYGALRLSGKKTGRVVVRLTDKSLDDYLDLTVTIVDGALILDCIGVLMDVEMDAYDEELVEEIKHQQLFLSGNTYALSKAAKRMLIEIDGDRAERIGVFTQQNLNEEFLLHVEDDPWDHTLMLDIDTAFPGYGLYLQFFGYSTYTWDGGAVGTRLSIAPSPKLSLVEDVTEKYQAELPAAGITKVEVRYVFEAGFQRLPEVR